MDTHFLNVNKIFFFKTITVLAVLVLDQFLVRRCFSVMQMNFADTKTPTFQLRKLMNSLSCMIKMKKKIRTTMSCIKLVNLVIFRNRKRNFHDKSIVFFLKRCRRISTALTGRLIICSWNIRGTFL